MFQQVAVAAQRQQHDFLMSRYKFAPIKHDTNGSAPPPPSMLFPFVAAMQNGSNSNNNNNSLFNINFEKNNELEKQQTNNNSTTTGNKNFSTNLDPTTAANRLFLSFFPQQQKSPQQLEN